MFLSSHVHESRAFEGKFCTRRQCCVQMLGTCRLYDRQAENVGANPEFDCILKNQMSPSISRLRPGQASHQNSSERAPNDEIVALGPVSERSGTGKRKEDIGKNENNRSANTTGPDQASHRIHPYSPARIHVSPTSDV